MDRQTVEQYVEQRIRDIFNDLAEQVGRGELTGDWGPEVAAVPLELTRASNYLVRQWWAYVEQGLAVDHTADKAQLAARIRE